MAKKYNKYYVNGDTVFVQFSNCNEYFLCDLEDWDKLSKYCWRKDCNGYAITNNNMCRGKIFFFHRLIMDVPDGMEVDHKYRVSCGVCDNRKSNLRAVTHQYNCRNRGTRKDSCCGFAGVSYDKRANKWFARIKIDGTYIYLGYFTHKDEAIKARQNAEIKYFGDSKIAI